MSYEPKKQGSLVVVVFALNTVGLEVGVDAIAVRLPNCRKSIERIGGVGDR